MKTLIISLNLLAISLVPFIFVGIVSVNHDAPTSIDAGSEVEVTITLNKGNITGPARIKLDFSSALGLSAEEVSSSGASFSYGDEVANFTWISIEPSDKIEIKYKIKAEAGAIGTKTISGKFTYLDEDERKTISIPSIIIEVKPNSNQANTTSTTNTETNPGSNETSNSSSSIEGISCSRSIEKSGDEFIVTLDLVKGNNKGFARIKDNLPQGFTAKEMQSDGSVFKFVDNSAKFLWSLIPADKSNLTVKYKLIPPAGASGNYSIDGEFSGEFLVINEVPQAVAISPTSFTVEGSGGVVVNNSNNNNSISNSNNNSNNINTNSNTSSSNSNETSSNSKEDLNGIKYKVQILAGHSNVSTSSIKKQYSFSDKITMENHDGWVKYCTGSFATYKDAKSKRNGLTSHNFPGPFVVAYNKGTRITVQEALAISNQNWVQ